MGAHLLLLHLTGRKSGRAITIPVAYRPVEGGQLLVLTNSLWRLNLRDRPGVEVTYRGVRRPAAAELVEDPHAVAQVYDALIREVGHAKAGRRMGIRINVDRAPTLDELRVAARREGLSLVYIDLDGESR
ncbi:nitroreductase/quinone reductase family protein [Cellulomonas sp. 179-A 4D5 NHS]|uniref:nitroreductase/quinone reductase family protein n=1 Tax=Cellulomonas sp. 179-A 4D5 NHS TaxID=3142378 RepID=UPI0039A2E886